MNLLSTKTLESKRPARRTRDNRKLASLDP